MVLVVVVVLATVSVVAQQQPLADSSARVLRDVRRQIERDRRSSDSLRSLWERQWRLSDSLRVESMLFRMRSDSLRRAVTQSERRELEMLQALSAPDTAPARDTVGSVPEQSTPFNADSVLDQVERVGAAIRRNRSGKVSAGRTLSDTITQLVMISEPDTGTASYYAEAFHGRRTSSGEIFDMHDRTCAHRWLPFNTHLLVTNLANGRKVVVRVTDRGPWKKTRIIDLSKKAAVDLDMIRAGTARVSIQVVKQQSAPTEADADGDR
ncbi:MAG: hypothetical protein RIR53_934 [Bacteroidota bacterium]